MKLLSDVDKLVTAEVDAERRVMVEGFAAEYANWWGRADSRLLLVTSGYSTAVREVLKRGIEYPNEIDVFIMASGRNGTVDSKLMCDSLKEVADHQRFRNITIGDEKSLLSFLDDATDVMLVRVVWNPDSTLYLST